MKPNTEFDEPKNSAETQSSFTKKLFINIVIATVAASFILVGLSGQILGQAHVAQVGGEKITLEKLKSHLMQKQASILSKYGSDFMKQITQDSSFKTIILDDLINEKLIELELKALGLQIGISTTKEFVKKSGQYSFQDGKFNEESLKQYLAQVGMSIETFLTQQSKDIRQNLISDLLKVLSKPSGERFAQISLIARNQKRTFNIYKISLNKSDNPTSKYEESTLRDFYQKNTDLFRLPQYKTVYISNITPESIKLDKPIQRQDILNFYRQEHILKTGNIDYHYLSFQSKADAEKFLSAVKDEGLSRSTAYEQITGNKYNQALVSNIPTKSLSNHLKKELYKVGEGQVTGIISISGKHCIAYIDKIQNNSKTLSRVEKQIKNTITKQRKCSKIKRILENAEILLDGGSGIEDVKGLLPNLEKIQFTDTQEGYLEQKDKWNTKLLFDISNNTNDYYGRIIKNPDSDCGYYLYKMQQIKPSEVPQFQNVKGKVIELYLKEVSKNNLRLRAENLLKHLSKTGSQDTKLPKLKKHKSITAKWGKLTGNANTGELQYFDGDIFLQPKGFAALSKYDTANESYYIAQVDKEESTPLENLSQDDVKKELEQLSTENQKTIEIEYFNHLRAKYGTKINYVLTNTI